MKCDGLNAYKADVTIPVYGTIADAEMYLKDKVDAAIEELKEAWRSEHKACEALKAELDKAITERDGNQTAIDELQAENAELKQKLMPCLNGDCILTCEVVEKYGKENAELKQKLEDVQASAYAESVDAGMENRRLKRALWLARAEWARSSALSYHLIESHPDKDVAETYKRKANKWENAKDKCLKKAEEYK